MPKSKKFQRQKQWHKTQKKNGKCWRCGREGAPIFNARGQIKGRRKLCPEHLEKDRLRKTSTKASIGI
jgi:hypothetical protein